MRRGGIAGLAALVGGKAKAIQDGAPDDVAVQCLRDLFKNDVVLADEVVDLLFGSVGDRVLVSGSERPIAGG